MSKTTEALAIEALEMIAGERVCINNLLSDKDIAREAIAAIREALADQFRDATKMVGCAYCDNPLFAGTKCNNCGRVTLAEPVKQEPVAWMDLHKELGQLRWMGGDEGWDNAIHAVRKRLEELYAAPVSAKPCKECGAKQAQIDRLMLEYCPDEMTHEQMQEWEKNIKPFVEPENQESVAWVDAKEEGYEFYGISCLPVGKHHLYAAPVDAKAIRAEALEEAAKWLKESGLIGSNDCAAAIRSLCQKTDKGG